MFILLTEAGPHCEMAGYSIAVLSLSALASFRPRLVGDKMNVPALALSAELSAPPFLMR